MSVEVMNPESSSLGEVKEEEEKKRRRLSGAQR